MYEDLGSTGTANFTINMDGSTQYAEENRGITPMFHRQPIQNPSKSAEAGRAIFDDIEVVTLFVAGDPYNQIVKPVDQSIKDRFPTQYEAWMKKQEGMTVSGTPIRQWPLLTPANVAEFDALKIFSVEALAGISDANVTKQQGLREWRERAKAWLASSKDAGAAAEYAAENIRLKGEMADLKKTVEELSAQVASLAVKKAKAAA